MHKGTEELFQEEQKLQGFLRDVSGYSVKDKEINGCSLQLMLYCNIKFKMISTIKQIDKVEV